jgi:hypothetical protein
MSKLNEKHKLFAIELLKQKMNVIKAYSTVYTDAAPESVKSNAYRLMENDGIQEYIQQLVEKEEKQDLITVEEIIEGIKRIGIKAEEKERLNEALKSFELLGKYKKMFTDKIEHTGKDGGPIKTANITAEMTQDQAAEIYGNMVNASKD